MLYINLKKISNLLKNNLKNIWLSEKKSLTLRPYKG